MSSKNPKVPGQQQPQPERHVQLQQSAYGSPIPIAYGENRLAANIVWADFFRAHSTGGGIGAGKKTGGHFAQVQFTYTISVAFCLAEGGRTNADNPNRIVDLLNIGTARPGNQAIILPDSVVAPGSFGSGAGANAKPQPVRGASPGAWKTKVVKAVGPKQGPFTATHFLDWTGVPHGLSQFPAPRLFVLPAGQTFTDGFTNNDPYSIPQRDRVTTVGTRHYAPENYPGLAVVLIQDTFLGSNASIPNWNFPLRGLQQFWQTDGVPETAGTGVEGPYSTYESAPDRVLSDLLINPKHGGGWDKLLSVLSGYNPAFEDASAFWRVNLSGTPEAESWGMFCRANGILISPTYDNEQPLSQIVDDLAALTDSAVVYSEGIFKFIPYADAASSALIGGSLFGTTYTYTPQTDPTVYTHGANIGVRVALSLDDFLPHGGEQTPIRVGRKSITPDQQTSSGYFNKIVITYNNRSNAYAQEPKEIKNEASINKYGLIPASPVNVPYICREELALDTGRRMLARIEQKRNTYAFTLGWWHLLWEPMDVVTLPGEGIDPGTLAGQHVGVRLTSVNENAQGELEMEAEEFPRATSKSVVVAPPPPDDSLDDLGGVIVGGFWSTLQAFDQEVAYASLGAGNADMDVRSPEAVYFVVPADMVITDLAVFYTHLEQISLNPYTFPNDFGGTTTVTYLSAFTRVNFFVNGVSRADLEVWFATADVGAVKFSQGALALAEGDRIAVEIRHFDVTGSPLLATGASGDTSGGTVSGANGKDRTITVVKQKSLNWTIGWIPG